MKRSLSLILILLTISFTPSVWAQSWNTVGSGLPFDTPAKMDAEVYNNELYVAGAIYNQQTSELEIRVARWNGLNWVYYPVHTLANGWTQLGDMEIFQGEIYIGLVDYFSNQDKLIKFDGTSWVGVTGSNASGWWSVSALEVHNGELIIGGDFKTTIGANTYNYTMKFDGSSYSALPGIAGIAGGGFYIKDIHIHNGTLSCFADSLYNWNGSVWDAPTSFIQGTSATYLDLEIIQSYNNELYGAGWSGVYRLDANDTAYFLQAINFKPTDLEVYNNELYIVGDSSLSGAGGGMTRYDGQIFTPIVGPPSLKEAAVYQGELYFFSPLTTQYNGLTYNRAFRTRANFSILSGTAFIDGNGDCFFNQGEYTFANALFGINGNYLTTNAQGEYAIALPPGTYSPDTVHIPMAVGKNFGLYCSLPQQITIGSGQSITQDLGVSNPVAVDAQVFLTGFTGWRARHGFTEAYRLDFNNAGNQTLASGSLQLQVPSSLTLISSWPAPASNSGNVLTYNFLNVQPNDSRKVILQFKVDTNQNAIGDSLQFVAAISGVNGDADLSDNSDTVNQTITAAVDPNDKQASASRILPGTEKVDYHIRFQNTGSDTAVKVTVVDTLDMSLPITRIVINSASHPYNLSVQNNILIWEFEDIMLPDSASDPLGSQGFVRFSAGLNPGLGIGDTIENDAEIYFDYQPAVHTNHAKTVIVQGVGLAEQALKELPLQVFPNPAHEFLNIENQYSEAMDIKILNISGQPIDQLSVKSGELLRYPLAELPAGIYLLQSEFGALRVIITE